MMETTTGHFFKGAKSQWGNGKIHAGTYNEKLGRWVAACQRLDPFKGGHDAYDGEHIQGAYELTCKSCASKAEQARWEPLIEAVRKLVHRHDSSQRGSYFYRRPDDGVNGHYWAKRIVGAAIEAGLGPDADPDMVFSTFWSHR